MVLDAVKANPAHQVLERLVGLSSHFDAASIEEVDACLEAGALPAVISFGNTIKKVSAIRRAHAAGITMFAFDSREELGNWPSMPPARASIAASW
jgi:ornithine decarboxylase